MSEDYRRMVQNNISLKYSCDSEADVSETQEKSKGVFFYANMFSWHIILCDFPHIDIRIYPYVYMWKIT